MKNLTLKVALVAVATFAGLSGFGQANTGATQWTVPANATINDYVQTSATVNKVTVNQVMPFWVWPSAAYNPSFAFAADVPALATGATISAHVLSNFTFSAWSDAAHTISLVPAEYVASNQSKNYVEMQFLGTPLAAVEYNVTRYIGVTETPTAVTCTGDPVYSVVQVIDEPMMRFTNAGTNQMGLTNVAAIGCDASAAIRAAATALGVTLDNTQENAIGAGLSERYNVNMTYDVSNYDVDGATGNLITKTVVATPGLNINDLTVDGTSAPGSLNPVKATSTTLIPGKNYILEGVKATVYTYTLVGWNAGISRKSDYIAYRATPGIAAYKYYTRNIAATPTLTARIIVLPKPVTGPIYHIANTWGL